MKEIRCVLLRHGKTKGNTEKRYIGCRSDEPLLSEEKNCFSVNKEIKEGEPVYVSPMLRAKETAELVFPGHKQIVIDALKETDFGRFEGKNYKELSGNAEYQAWIDSGGTSAFPDGEDPELFRNRSVAGFEEALQNVLADGKDSLWLVAHGGTLMSIMSRLTEKGYYDFMVNCGEGFEVLLEISDNGYDLVSYNSFSGRNHS